MRKAAVALAWSVRPALRLTRKGVPGFKSRLRCVTHRNNGFEQRGDLVWSSVLRE